MMRTYDLSPLYRTAIGFDHLAQRLNDLQRSDNEVNYPPYNIELISEDQYRIVMAVAGFAEDELEIETAQQALKVTGNKEKETDDVTFLHRGIAARNFEHTFQLADHVKVTDANLENGLLTVFLEREVPEALKPKKIAINTNKVDNKLLSQKAA